MYGPSLRHGRPLGGGGGGRRGGGGGWPAGPTLHQSRHYPINPVPQMERPRPADPSPHPSVPMHRVEAAVAKARADLLQAGESLSPWKVSQAAAAALQTDVGGSLWFQLQDARALRDLVLIDGKVTAFIHCFVNVRKFTSVHELSIEICKSEGVEQFEELGLGSLLRHPLVQQYFSIPPDVTEVPQITSGDIISRLDTYMYRHKKKEIAVEEFLDFLAKKFLVAKENLGVRIRNLGLHIKYIFGARRTEFDSLEKARQARKQNIYKQAEEGELSQKPTTILQKQEESLRDLLVPESLGSVQSLSGMVDDDNDDVHKKLSRSLQQSLSPGAKEDITSSSISKNKKLSERNRGTDIATQEFQVRNEKILQAVKAVRRTEKIGSDIWTFISRWNEASKNHTVAEVSDMMVRFHCSPFSLKRLRKATRNLATNPAAHLLDVFVTFSNIGLLDLIFEDHEADHESKNTDYIQHLEREISVPETSLSKSITTNEIIKKIAMFFENNHLVIEEKQPHFALFKKLCDCGAWLETEFSVKDFCYLGHGNFFEFLENNFLLLPAEIQNYNSQTRMENSTSEILMAQDQLQLFLAQAGKNMVKDGPITRYCVSLLLKRQFPTVCFQIIENDVDRKFSALINSDKESGSSNNVIFSAALLGENYTGSSGCIAKCPLEISEMVHQANQQVCSLGNVSNEDAIQCLLKAPMLSDLHSWSHWDIIFAPSLGPMLEWLLTETQSGDFSCIVTNDGKIIRVEPSTTPDDFLDSAARCSSFQTVVKLLSLLSLYGGTGNFPLALIKCYAQRAIEIIIRNSVDHMTSNENESSQFHEKSLHDQDCTENYHDSRRSKCHSYSSLATSKSYASIENHSEAINNASKFVLDCLCYLPLEFCCFGAEILMTGLQSVTNNAPLIILHHCKHIEERLILHHIGLSLGIVEWNNDYHTFISALTMDIPGSLQTVRDSNNFHSSVQANLSLPDSSHELLGGDIELLSNVDLNCSPADLQFNSRDKKKSIQDCNSTSDYAQVGSVEDAINVIETIRREEFGLDTNLMYDESNFLMKQHDRLGRALHCLSQELYSQDSHLLLELIQNADDNIYPKNVEPTLVFILQSTGIIVLNNEIGFSADNIRALCDVGNSTKKGSSAGYIGKKGIGFKSVFRVTEVPEIHSNGFHLKFDAREGPIGFILPTVIPPCDMVNIGRLLSSEQGQADSELYKTCIVLPFRPDLRERIGINSVFTMFSDLHPSLLLFLHRIQCLKFKNMLNDTLVVIKKETLRDGIIKISHGSKKMNWLVVSRQLQGKADRSDIQTTEISVAFTLEESDNEQYKVCLSPQPVFAFLPLRGYGLKFILQGDFVLPSSREEVDSDSAWNQWLLSEFPSLFVMGQRSFCSLRCFKENPAEAVSAFMSFVPLVGEVFGFFSHLPRMIMSKLCMSNCLILDDNMTWAPPYKVLRGWNASVQILMPDNLLQKYLGLGYLNRGVFLSDALSKALGVIEYGPKFLVDFLLSICTDEGRRIFLSLQWVSSWLTEFDSVLSVHTARNLSLNSSMELDFFKLLRKVPFIPLSDGSYSSLVEGPIWLPFDFVGAGNEGRHSLKNFPKLYSLLRIVSPSLFEAVPPDSNITEGTGATNANIMQLLVRMGLQELSAHDVIKIHILPAFFENKHVNGDVDVIAEYLSYMVLHFQYACPVCQIEKVEILSKLKTTSIILTNNGYKCPLVDPVHFGKDFGNKINMKKLIDPRNYVWNEVDSIYLKFPNPGPYSSSLGLDKWRGFFEELGVTDFVQVRCIEKNASDIFFSTTNCMHNASSLVSDWESPELFDLLSTITSQKDPEKCKYLMKILDRMWESYFCEKSYILFNSKGNTRDTKSSFLTSILNMRWVLSSTDEELHYPRDVFCDCEIVRSILGANAPYAVPQVRSKRFIEDLGFKTQVSLDDALKFLHLWRVPEGSFKTSISQMTKFYMNIADNVSELKEKIELKPHIFIFIPSKTSNSNDAVSGVFLSAYDVYWKDSTGCVDQVKNIADIPCRALSTIYPSLHDFFVTNVEILEKPNFGSYFQTLSQLSSSTSPSQASYAVFMIFQKWADDLESGNVTPEDINDLKESLSMLENAVLPTAQDKWVSLHPSFGLTCWSDNDELVQQFKHTDEVQFLQFGKLNSEEKAMLSGKIAILLRKIGIHAFSEVLTRDAVFYGSGENREIFSLIDWALPYVQRYLLKFHHGIYLHMKHVGCEKFCRLQIVVVEKLFCKYRLKGRENMSTKRLHCNCLLQDNILYVTLASDPHTIFLELSRLFFDGCTELHLANFLHMITTKAEAGCTEEQLELFTTKNLNVPKLLPGDSVWSLTSSSCTDDIEAYEQASYVPNFGKRSHFVYSKQPRSSSHWPPSSTEHLQEINHAGVVPLRSGIEKEWIAKDVSENIMVSVFSGTDIKQDVSNFAGSSLYTDVDAANTRTNLDPGGTSICSENFLEMDKYLHASDDMHSYRTGRLGESVAHKHFSEKLSAVPVRWVNQGSETGLPYDLVIGDKPQDREYIEVKATTSADKNWFPITTREWQFAVEKGDLFSIAYVVLDNQKNASITVLKNPFKLCKQGDLHLAVLISKQKRNPNSSS